MCKKILTLKSDINNKEFKRSIDHNREINTYVNVVLGGIMYVIVATTIKIFPFLIFNILHYSH